MDAKRTRTESEDMCEYISTTENNDGECVVIYGWNGRRRSTKRGLNTHSTSSSSCTRLECIRRFTEFGRARALVRLCPENQRLSLFLVRCPDARHQAPSVPTIYLIWGWALYGWHMRRRGSRSADPDTPSPTHTHKTRQLAPHDAATRFSGRVQ